MLLDSARFSRKPVRLLWACTALVAICFLDARPAPAEGLLDDLDYCIELRRQFDKDSHEMRREVAKSTADGLENGPSIEFGRAWWRRTFSNLYLQFESNWGDQITQSGGDVSKGFLAWWNMYGLQENGGPEGLKASMEMSFERIYLEERAKEEGKVSAEIQRRNNELSEKCKEDVGSQIVRFSEAVLADVVEGALAPGEIVVGNFEGAKRESGIGAKIIRITTGISIKDAWNNPAGGENSEFNKAKDAVEDVIEDLPKLPDVPLPDIPLPDVPLPKLPKLPKL